MITFSYITKIGADKMEQNLSQYRIFYTVATTGNITKAADKLYISQPAISKSIKNLETSLGVTLFSRNSRGVSLTEEGKLLYNHVRRAFNEIYKGEEELKQSVMLGIGTIRISVSSALCKYILLPYLKKFIRINPHIKFNIECNSTTHSLKMLREEKSDIGLIGKTNHQNDLVFHSLGNINYVFIATESYLNNLKMRGAITERDIFSMANIMLLDSENISRQHINNYLSMNNLEADNILEVNNMDLLIDFAKTGIGIACVIKEFASDDIKNGKVQELKLSVPIPSREIGFAYCKNAVISASMQKFIDFYTNESPTFQY